MLVVLAPSKTMDMTPGAFPAFSQPVFQERAAQLVDVLRGLSVGQIMALMQVSEKLGALNRQRFADWQLPFTPENAKQALFAFSGDVYEGLAAETWSSAEVEFADGQLRILSGLYGLLRPLDLMMPYRLEMGCKLGAGPARTLYDFWREAVTAALNDSGETVLVNLASQEYFKVIDRRALKMDVVSPVFKDEKNGQLKVISSYAKKARGMMARFLVQNRIGDVNALTGFAEAGYSFDESLSTDAAPVFVRAAGRDR